MQAALIEAFSNPSFTPTTGLMGGLLLGVSSTFHLACTGRITGVSGILNGTLQNAPAAYKWRPAWLAGFFAGTAVFKTYQPSAFGHHREVLQTLDLAAQAADFPIPTALGVAAVSGAMVGFGVRMGHGCTSGHGVCGLPRFSTRSLFAVGSFMTTGVLTAVGSQLLWAKLGYASPVSYLSANALLPALDPALLAVPPVLLAGWAVKDAALGKKAADGEDGLVVLLAAHGSGILFAMGLGLSGMTDPAKVLAFLDPVSHQWDPTLVTVLGGAVGFNVLSFRPVLAQSTPWLTRKWEVPTRKDLDSGLVKGGGLFGMGWGLGGYCPAPGLAGLVDGDPFTLVWTASLLTSMKLYDKLQ